MWPVFTNFFSVDKGATDIRMVYNGTSCGLNNILHAPHFGLPMERDFEGTASGVQCNFDVQDQFLNFKLHKHMQEFSGVDVKEVRSLASEDAMWEHQDWADGSNGKGIGWASGSHCTGAFSGRCG